MGYESRVYVAVRHIYGKDKEFNYGETIAVFNLSKMGDPFPSLFTTPIDFCLYAEDGDTPTWEDCYGESLKYAPLKKIKEYISELAKISTYRRLKPFLGFLEGINESDWDEVVVVHYGY